MRLIQLAGGAASRGPAGPAGSGRVRGGCRELEKIVAGSLLFPRRHCRSKAAPQGKSPRSGVEASDLHTLGGSARTSPARQTTRSPVAHASSLARVVVWWTPDRHLLGITRRPRERALALPRSPRWWSCPVVPALSRPRRDRDRRPTCPCRVRLGSGGIRASTGSCTAGCCRDGPRTRRRTASTPCRCSGDR
jgi:hypothetical protein